MRTIRGITVCLMCRKKKIFKESERSYIDYFKDINKFSPLSKDEERILWEKYKKHNDIDARNKIITSNLKFVARVASKYVGMGLSYPELIAEGNHGLMKAISKFDYERNFKTISYSVWWIRQSILEALNKRNSINGDELPECKKELLDYDTDIEYNVNDVDEAYVEQSDFESLKDYEQSKMASMLLDCLTQRERSVIVSYFGLENKEEKTLEEIGAEFGLTKERIRQIKECALKKLRSEALEKSMTSEIYA